MSKTPRIVCFGEVLIRLSAPGREVLLQNMSLNAHVGGAEANVAVSLARFGLDARMVSLLPENVLADAAIGELRRHGVDTSLIARGAGRMGLYFISPGAIHRPSDVLYDRADSAFARAASDAIDWSKALDGADWLHLSGVTLAISAKTSVAALRAAKAARAAGVKVSVDCNFRQRLWDARGDDPRPVLGAIFAEADLMFADHRDIELVTGKKAEGADKRAAAMEIAFATWPNLKRVAGTQRSVVSADHNELGGVMFTRDGRWTTKQYAVTPIVDRIGGGDAFAAGLLYGLNTDLSDQDSLDFAIAAACLKHSIPGDFNLSSVADVRAFLSQNGSDVRR